jgi:cytochrome c556
MNRSVFDLGRTRAAARMTTVSLALVLGMGAAQAQVVGKPEDKVRWRQSAYQVMGWNMQRLKANLEGKFDAAQAIQAANVIAALANSGMGALYAADAKGAKGWHEAKVKPEFYADPAGVGKVAKAFMVAADDMAKAAASGDASAVKTKFAALGEACKACHKDYRVKDD